MFNASLQGYWNIKSLENDLKNFKFDFPLELYLDENILKAKTESKKNIFCDFLEDKFLLEVRQNYSRGEGVYSFIKKDKEPLKICDLTVGMGRDFFKFVFAGHNVTGYERNPLIYHLVNDGIKRFEESKKLKKIKNQFKRESFNFQFFLGEAQAKDSFDLIYYDPMFSDTSKKAAPKKKMQFLKEICVESDDSEKIKTALDFKPLCKTFVLKSSILPQELSFTPQREIKGKGFSYFIF